LWLERGERGWRPRKPPNIIVRLLRGQKREEFGHSTINLNITYLIICFEMGFEMAGIIELFDESMIRIVLWLKVPGLMNGRCCRG
jgi:hypothetical protein